MQVCSSEPSQVSGIPPFTDWLWTQGKGYGVEKRGERYRAVFSGNIPEISIPIYVGKHPGELVEGFSSLHLPPQLEWMVDSRIVAIENSERSIYIELEPFQGDAS